MIYIALPIKNEMDWLPMTLESIFCQNEQDFCLVCCVNQPEAYWNDKENKTICENNQQTIEYLKSLNDNRIVILDKSSEGNGWLVGKEGVGFARKHIMDYIAEIANDDDIIISIDADTIFEKDYFEKVARAIYKNPKKIAFSLPYYHRLSGESALDFSMLRYEIYMRSYAINMWLIGNPYCFTALGSAIALTVRAYKYVGGMTPKKSGEDFYFLQRLVKHAEIGHYCDSIVFPATRFSNRVFFGTGPALIKGAEGEWKSYPIYNPKGFEKIKETFDLFEKLFVKDVPTPLDDFLIRTFKELPWKKLRENFKTTEQFERACIEKIDGLRILQYLKSTQEQSISTDIESLASLLSILKVEHSIELITKAFEDKNVINIDRIRNILFDFEMEFRYRDLLIL